MTNSATDTATDIDAALLKWAAAQGGWFTVLDVQLPALDTLTSTARGRAFITFMLSPHIEGEMVPSKGPRRFRYAP